MDWYVSRQGLKRGPFSEAQIRALLHDGDLAPHHLGWRFGLAGWTPLANIGEFQSSGSAPGTGEQYKNVALRRLLAAVRNKGSDEPGQESSYCVRHWRGELSLAVSFWINGNLPSLALITLVFALTQTDIVNQAPRWFSAGGVFFWCLLAVITVWQLVGVWRSAGNYLAGGQPKYWGRLAQAMVILSILASAFGFASVGLPQSMEFAKLALGRDPVGSYQLSLLRQGTELEISGAIVFGLTGEVAKMLDAHPKVKIIHLNSNGGRIREARMLRDLIASRKLATFTSTGCFSACTLAYAAGERRLISKNASLGFHQYAFPGTHQSAFRYQHEKDKSDWLARGVDRAFVDRAYATPHDDLWRPAHQVLIGARFVTGYPDSEEVAMSDDQHKNIAGLGSETSNQALLTALKDHEPAVYRRAFAKLQTGSKKENSQAEIWDLLLPIARTVYRKNLPRASDVALLRFTDLFIEQTQALYDTDPRLCYQYVYASRQNADADFDRHFSQALKQKEISVLVEVIRSAATLSTQVQIKDQVQHKVEEIFAALMERHGSSVALLANPARGEPRAAEMCVFTRELYQAIRRLPEIDSATVLRFMFANAK